MNTYGPKHFISFFLSGGSFIFTVRCCGCSASYQANSFKPHVATYTKAAELIGLPVDQILFVANHAFDCIGAKSAGMRTAFIDRRSRPFGVTPHQPDILVPTMKDLADAIV